LTDGQIVLDGFTLEDVADHLAGEDEEQARRFGWYPKRSTEETARAAILQWQGAWQDDGDRVAWAAREAGSRVLVGGCELKLRGDGLAEMSWWIFPPHRRRGLATRAIRLAGDYAFAHLGVRRIDAQIEPDNVGSRRAAENAGFVLQGPAPDLEMDDGTKRAALRYSRTRGAAQTS
jgi:RimJ/RimL family protein N-acetyltransferase